MKKSLCTILSFLVSLNVFLFAGPGCHEEHREVGINFNYKSDIPEYDFTNSNESQFEIILDYDKYLLLSKNDFSTLKFKEHNYSYNDVYITLDKYGYKHVYLKNTLDKHVPSKDILLINTYSNDEYVIEKSFVVESKELNKSLVPVLNTDNVPGSKYPGVNKLNGIYFANPSASSYLTEGKRIYKPEGILCKYFNSNVQNVSLMSKSALPWVEGKSDAGIGEYIEFDIDGWKQHYPDIYILNGYVAPDKPALFKENNRIKKALIETDSGLKKIVEFRDQVEFTGIKLTENTSHVKITILEVYEGTKYNDTCLSSIDIYYGFWDK